MPAVTSGQLESGVPARWMSATVAGRFLDQLGGIAQMGGSALGLIVRGRVDLEALVEQIDKIGLASVSVTMLTAVFSSMVMAVQFAVQMDRFGAKEWVGSIVSLSLVRELGPVLTALMVGGRVGSGIAAEIGSMNVTEQVDALRSMGADPIETLVVPRVLAAILVLPLLTAFADALGVAGAMVITRVTANVNMRYFYNAVLRSVEVPDMAGGLVKTLFFGLAIGLIGCYLGLTASGGTEGVGRATTRTVVISSLSILIGDFLLTNILLGFGLLISDDFIRFVHVEKSFGEKRVCVDFNLEVKRGEVLTLLGGSGSGKSVALKLLIGLLPTDAGRIEVDGVNVAGASEEDFLPVRRRISMLFQSSALFDSLSVGDNVAYPLRILGKFSAAEIRDRVAQRLEMVGLPGIEATHPSDLSGGMRKRVGLARAIVGDPDMILYDEPTTGLDPINTRRINELILSIQQRLKITSLVVTHDLPSAFMVSNRLAMLFQGRIVAELAGDEFRRSQEPAIRDFINAMPSGGGEAGRGAMS